MVWDGECSFCKKFAERSETRSKNLVEFIPYQLLSGKYPDAPKYDYQNSVFFLENSGSTSGAEAIFNFFKKTGIKWPNISLLYTSPSPRDKRQSRMPSSA